MARRESTPESPGSRALIVDLIRSSGPISRVELTQATGLTQPAVSMIVRKLLDDNVIVEAGSAPSTGGKPRKLLDINRRARIGIGVQLGFEAMTLVATDTNGGVLARQRLWGARQDEPTAVVSRIAEAVDRFLEGSALRGADAAGVAVVVPGPIDAAHGGMLNAPALRPWTGFALREELERRIDAPVLVDNDASAAAVGEFWSRGVSRYSSFGAIYIGTGIGAGVVVDGALHRGASSNAAELGHITVDPDGPQCSCGNWGCLELYASPGALVASTEGLPDFEGLDLSYAAADSQASFDALSRAAVAGHTAAEALLTRGARLVAAATLTLCNLFDLDEVVLTGPGLANAGSIYARETRTALTRAFARHAHDITAELSSNPRDAAAIGAAAMTLQEQLAPGHGLSTPVINRLQSA